MSGKIDHIQKKPVERGSVKHETGQLNESNWKQVVFKNKPKSEVVADKSDIESEAESDESDNSQKSDISNKSNKSDKSNKSNKSDSNSSKEEIMLRSESSDSPISSTDLQCSIKAKHVNISSEPILFDIGNDTNNGEITVTDKLNELIMLCETTTSRLTKQAEGYDSSTKCLLEKNKFKFSASPC